MLSVDEIKETLIQVKNDFDISNMRLCITGGEPLLRPEFFEIMEYAQKLGFAWGMTSNGTLIDKNMAAKLRKTGLRTVSISVDGLKENHEWFRQSPGCYEKTIEGIKNLIEVVYLSCSAAGDNRYGAVVAYSLQHRYIEALLSAVCVY